MKKTDKMSQSETMKDVLVFRCFIPNEREEETADGNDYVTRMTKEEQAEDWNDKKKKGDT